MKGSGGNVLVKVMKHVSNSVFNYQLSVFLERKFYIPKDFTHMTKDGPLGKCVCGGCSLVTERDTLLLLLISLKTLIGCIQRVVFSRLLI